MTSLRIPSVKALCAVVLMLPFGGGVMHGRDNCVRSHLDAPVVMTDSTLRHEVGPHGLLEELTIEVRAALSKVKERPGMSRSWWGISLVAPADTVKVSLRFGNTDYGDILDRRVAVLTVERNGVKVESGEVEGFRTAGGDFNSLELSLTAGTLGINGGGHCSRHLTDVAIGGEFMPERVELWSIGRLSVPVFAVEVCRPPAAAFASGYTADELAERFSRSTDPIEGYWTYFDRENDPMYARPGGRYTLALVRRVSDETERREFVPVKYDIVYVDGAKTFGDKWEPLMLKGVLSTTIFDGHYDLEWIDATFERMTDDIHATIDNASLLTLSFPLLKTTMRFSKMPGRFVMPGRE